MRTAQPAARRVARFAGTLMFAVTVGASAAADAAPTPRPSDPGPGETERIQFAAGADSSTVDGTIAAGQVDRYVLSAAAGQTMFLDLAITGERTRLAVFAPDGTELVAVAEILLPAIGDYVIEVGPSTSDVTYTLNVRIPAGVVEPGPAGTRRIEFAPGSDNATVEGSVSAGQADRYELRAAAGQTLFLGVGIISGSEVISETEGLASIGVSAPDGMRLETEPQLGFGGWDFERRLTQTGDYVVEIGSSTDVTYMLSVWIPPEGAAPQPPEGAAPQAPATLPATR